MFSPQITIDEAERWKEWLSQFGLELYTTVINGCVYPVDLKDKHGDFLSGAISRD